MIRFTLRVTLFSVIATLIVTLAGLLWLMTTANGARMAAGFVSKLSPAIVIDVEQGNLLAGVDIRYFSWRDTEVPQHEAVKVELMGVQLDWSWLCLLSGEACVDRLAADRLVVTVPDTESTDQSSGLSEVSLPLLLHLREGKIGVLSILSGTTLTELKDVDLSATWQNEEIRASRVAVTYDGVTARAAGVFGMGKPWVTDLSGQITGAGGLVSLDAWRRRLGLDRDLPFRLYGNDLFLHLDTELSGEIPMAAKLSLDTQPASTPFKIELNSTQSLPWAYENTHSRLTSWKADWRGSLTPLETVFSVNALDKTYGLIGVSAPIEFHEQGIRLGDATLDTTLGSLALSGEWLFGNEKKAERDRLALSVNFDQVRLSDSPLAVPLTLDGALAVAGSLSGKQFDSDWTLSKLTVGYGDGIKMRLSGPVRVDGDDDAQNIRLDLKADQSSLPVDAWVANGQVRAGQVAIEHSTINVGKAALALAGVASYSAPYAWDLQFDLEHLSPALAAKINQALKNVVVHSAYEDWQDRLRANDHVAVAGRTRGRITEAGELDEVLLDLSRLEGVINGLPMKGGANLDWNTRAERLSLKVDLASAESTAQVAGTLTAAGSDLSGRITRFDLGAWLPGIEGVVNADFDVKGSIRRPDVSTQFEVSQLTLPDLAIAQVQGRLDLPELGKGVSRAELALSGLQVAEVAIDDVTLALSGDTSAFSADLTLNTEAWGTASLGCDISTVMTKNELHRLDADCSELSYNKGAQAWGLVKAFPASVTLPASPRKTRVHVGETCLAVDSQGARKDAGQLCLNRLSWQPDLLDAGFSLDQLEARELARVVEVDLPLLGVLSGRGKIRDEQGKPLFAELQVASPALAASGAEQAALKDVIATVNVNQDSAQFQLSGATPAQGDLSVDVAVDEIRGDRTLAGNVSLAGLGLHELSALYPEIGVLAGELNAQAALSGSLAAPDIQGGWQISEGRYRGAAVDFPLEGVELAGTFTGDAMHFSGAAETQGGQLKVDGDLNWKDHWFLDVKAESEHLEVVPRSGVALWLKPALQLRLEQGMASLTGNVLILKAEVILQTLPQNARSVSTDVVYVETQPKRTADTGAWKYLVNVRLDLGERVHFKGFGVDTYLQGGLRLTQSDESVLTAGGQVTATRGELTYWGQTLKLDRATMVFQGALDNPQLDIRASRKIVEDSVVVGLDVTGSALKPNVGVFSEPEMDETDASYYLVTGRKPEPGQTVGSEVLSNLLLSGGGLAGGWIAGGLMEKVGVSDFQINTQSEAGGTTVQLSGYITPDLQLRYGVKLFDEVNSLAMRYRLGSNLFIEAMSGLNTSLDVIYSFEIK